jgi:hypothetical protein
VLIRWYGNDLRKFTVKSVYQQLTGDDDGRAYQEVWKAKIPLKIKIFMWMVIQRAILTKDNLVLRNWHGDPGCYFCGASQNVDHLCILVPCGQGVLGDTANLH